MPNAMPPSLLFVLVPLNTAVGGRRDVALPAGVALVARANFGQRRRASEATRPVDDEAVADHLVATVAGARVAGAHAQRAEDDQAVRHGRVAHQDQPATLGWREAHQRNVLAAGRALVEASALRQPAAGLRPGPEDVLAHLGRQAAHLDLLEDGDRRLQVTPPLVLGSLLERCADGGIPRRLSPLVETGAQRSDALLLGWELGLEPAQTLQRLGPRALAHGQLA